MTPAEPNPRLVIAVRATVDWENESAFRAQLAPTFAPKVDTWDRTFSLPYHQFRAALRRIAADNHGSLPGVTSMSWDAVPTGAWVLPVDDDDWFAPELPACLINAVTSHATGVRWVQTTLEVPINFGHRLFLWRRRLIPSTPPRWLCNTNNYAIRKGPMGSDEFLKHTVASQRFAAAPDIVVISRHLSVHNRSLASITSMGFRRQGISPRTLLAKWKAYLRLYATYRVAHRELAWTRPFVQRMHELMQTLDPR